MNRDLWLPVFGIAFVAIAIMVLVGVCTRVSADQPPLPTRTPTVEPTYTPAPTMTAYVAVSTPIPTLPPAPTSTLTPLPTATATQERRSSEFSTPVPTSTLQAPFTPSGPPAQVPAQVPRR